MRKGKYSSDSAYTGLLNSSFAVMASFLTLLLDYRLKHIVDILLSVPAEELQWHVA